MHNNELKFWIISITFICLVVAFLILYKDELAFFFQQTLPSFLDIGKLNPFPSPRKPT